MIIMNSSYERTNATSGHAAMAAPNQAMPQAVRHVGRERRRYVQSEQPPRQRTGTIRRAVSSNTIELA
jgi:hypothetical protein